jgi:hypothetical protein
MKIQIEIDCTPEELKDLLIPSDRQAEFAAKAYKAMVEAMGEAMMKQFGGLAPGRKD